MNRRPEDFTPALERYLFASQYCKGRRVLDLGSKDGYGSHLLSQFAFHIIQADRNHYWMSIAKNQRYYCPVSYQLVNFESSFPEGDWDVAVALDVIEHVANGEFFVDNIAKALIEDGLLIFSVPHLQPNSDHKALFDEEGIKKLISRRFKIKEFYTHSHFCVSEKPIGRPEKVYVGVAIKK